METILIANEKGGAGKSSTTLCLANCLSALGYKVLIIDTDPSGNLSAAALPENPSLVLYDVIDGACDFTDAIVHTGTVDIVPTIKDLDAPGLTIVNGRPVLQHRKNLGKKFGELEGSKGTEQFISLLIQTSNLEGIYDFILIDTPPAANHLITNGIVAADSLIIPCEPNAASYDGLDMIIASVVEAVAKYQTQIQVDGMVFARYSDNSATRREHTKMLTEKAQEQGIYIYNTKFWTSPAIELSMNECRPVLDYPYNGRGLDDSMAFTLEFLAKRGLEPKHIYPGILKDENGNWIFRKNGTVYYTFSVTDGVAQVEEKRFRLEHLTDEFKGQIGKTIFFFEQNLQTALATQGIPVRDTSTNNSI